MRDRHRPVGRDFPQRGRTEAGVLRVVEIVFDHAGVVGIDEVHVRQIGVGLEAAAQRANGHAVRTDGPGRTEARAFAGVAGARDIVDIAALIVEIDHTTQREGVGDGHIDHRIDLVARLAALGEGHAGVEPGIEAAKVGLVGNQANDARLRTGTEQRTLRTREHFDPRQIGGIDIEVAARLRERLLVEIHGDVRRETRDARGGEVGRGRGEAANIDRALARAATARSDGRQLLEVILEGVDGELFEPFFADRGNRDGHVLQIFAALLRGDDDDVDAALAFLGGRCGVLRRNRRGGCNSQRAQRRTAYKIFHFGKPSLSIMSQLPRGQTPVRPAKTGREFRLNSSPSKAVTS